MSSGDITHPLLDNVNAIRVTKDDLASVFDAAEATGIGGRNAGAVMYLITKRYMNDPNKAGAVLTRYHALNRLLSEMGVRGWNIPATAEHTAVSTDALLGAAAIEPVVDIGNEPAFEHDAFIKRVLDLMETPGRA
jgi:hypothetical protein